MTHPIVSLQTALLAVLEADAALVSLIGAGAVFDAPPKGQLAPYVAIARHDLQPRDGDLTPGHEHRLVLNAFAASPSRKAVLELAERLIAVALGVPLGGPDLLVTNARHERTKTSIDLKTGQARAAIALRFYSEPAG